MSQFIQIAIEPASEVFTFSRLYALDDEGTVWERYLDLSGTGHELKDRPFQVLYRSTTEPKPKKERKAKGGGQTIEEWMEGLRKNPAYVHIQFDQEFGKMQEWLKLHEGRKLTKRFILNWLNKIEVPISIESFGACPNRVRKEGKSFMQPCGKPGVWSWNGKWYCLDCHESIAGRG